MAILFFGEKRKDRGREEKREEKIMSRKWMWYLFEKKI